MLVRASSTARVIDLPCAMGNPRVSVRRSTAPRTVENHLGLLYSASINNRPPRSTGFLSWSLLATGREKVFVCDTRGLLGEVVGCFEVAAKEPDLAVYILLEKGRSVRARELAVNRDGCGAGNSCYLPGLLAACLKVPNRAMKDDEVGDTRGVAVAVAIHMRESVLLELPNQVFVKRNLEFSGQFDFARFNHLNLERRRLDLCGLVLLGQKWRSTEDQREQGQLDPRVENALHCFCSLLGEELELAAELGSPEAVVWAPWATRSFLMTSAVPIGIEKMAPCRPPSASRYCTVSVSIFVRNKLRTRPPP